MARNKREKYYKKIKNASLWGPIITFFIAMVAGVLVVAGVGEVITYYVVESKFISEYAIVENIVAVYESDLSDSDIKSTVKSMGRDYIIVDKNDKVLYSSGENTCSFKGGELSYVGDNGKIVAYEDAKNPAIDVSNTGMVFLSLGNFMNFVESDKTDIGIEVYNYTDYDIDSKIVSFAMWVESRRKSSDNRSIVKSEIIANQRDVKALVFLMIFLALAYIGMLTVLFINAIRGVLKQRAIAKVYYLDDITMGNNWRYFVDKGELRLKKHIAARHSYAVVNLVFVNYRNYCVCHSVEAGEELLKIIYNILAGAIKTGSKELCVRSATSSFALLLNCESEEEVKIRLDRIINVLENIDSNHKFSFQAGTCIIPKSVNDRGMAVRRKKLNLEAEYNNACAARNAISDNTESGISFFNDKIVEDQRWLDIVQENQIKAVKNEEFKVFYQPKYDPRTKELKGAEALIRWISPEYGFISPGKFIPIFEKNGFITEIDHYMIEHVARDQKAWLDQGFKCVPVSVNVSRAHFAERDLADQICKMIDDAGTPHNLIEIELTESAFFDDKDAMVYTINRLKEHGFAVSMDDFGSGYSSLNSLKDMPLDVLKLDAEFFRGEFDNDRGGVVVSEAIRLAKLLNMRTVAEGIEVEEQVDFLANEGCDMIQGFYFDKPMPGDEYEERMNK